MLKKFYKKFAKIYFFKQMAFFLIFIYFKAKLYKSMIYNTFHTNDFKGKYFI